MNVMVEASARHVHLSESDAKALFGRIPAKVRDLSQPGQFVCDERVTIVGPKFEIKNVAILGPCRNKTQVEISTTDSLKLGIKAPIRESGHLDGSAACKLVGSEGEVDLSEGVIIAKRHIHMPLSDSEKSGIANGTIVKVSVKSDERSLIFDDVVVRVSEKFALAMHIDTDEANACGFKPGIKGEIIMY